MAAPQEDPPFPERGFTPIMMEFIRPLYGWLRRNRAVDSDSIFYVDAPGGGKMAGLVNPPGRPKRFLCFIDGEPLYADILITGTAPVEE